jgi:hypothetical protein
MQMVIINDAMNEVVAAISGLKKKKIFLSIPHWGNLY